jgi:hypothetical protein
MVLALILLASLLICVWTPGMTILGDEWRYAYWTSTEGALGKGFDPELGKYAIPVPLVAYQGLFEVFGLDSYVPYRIMSLLLLATVAVLMFELLRRRIGAFPALPFVALILFLGTSAEVVATSLRSPAMISLAAGLGALLLLERPARIRDLAVAVLLTVGVASHPGGLAFCAAVAIVVAGDRRGFRVGLTRAWTFAVPILVFLLFLRPGETARENGTPLGERIIEAPGYLIEGVVGLIARMIGVGESALGSLGFLGGVGSPIAWVAAVSFIAAIAVTAFRRSNPAPLLAYFAAALLLIGGALLAPGGVREPNLTRYVLPAGVMLIVTFAELIRNPEWLHQGLEPKRRLAIGAGSLLLAFGIASNAVTLESQGREFGSAAVGLRAELLAYELAVDLNPLPEDEFDNDRIQDGVGANRMPLLPSEYAVVADDYGTPALSLSEVNSDYPESREVVLFVLEYLATKPVPDELLAEIEGDEP